MSAASYTLPRRSITSAQLLTQLGLDHGLSVERCLHQTGLSPLQLAELRSEIEGAQELQLIRNLIDALPAQYDFGLQAGLRYQLTTYGIWGYALLSSQTFRQAAELGLRYLDLTFAFNRITLREDAIQAHLELDGSHLPDQVRDFLLQRDAVAVMVIQRQLTRRALSSNSACCRSSPAHRIASASRAIYSTCPCPAPIRTARNSASCSARPCWPNGKCAAAWLGRFAIAC